MKNKKLRIRNYRKRKTGTLVLLIFLISFIINPIFMFADFGSSITQEEDFTIEWGDNVYQDVPYWFNGTFYESTNPSFVYSNAKLELEYIPDNTVYYNETIVENFDISAYTYPVETDFDLINGTMDWNNNLTTVDDEFTTFYSSEVEHYPGTFSFTDDTIGTAPTGWANDVEAVIVDSWESHRNVLQLTRDGSNPEIEQVFDSVQINGIIELYAGSSDVTQLSHIRLYDGASSVLQVNLYQDKLQYYTGAYNPILDPIFDDTWYHLKIVFECDTGGLEGLAADTFYIYVDEVQYGPYAFNNVAPHVDKIYFTCNSGAVYCFYIDAVGYSWDTDYLLGDNYNWNYYPATHDLENYDITLDGNYIGTFSFEDDLVGNAPVGFDNTEDSVVVASQTTHNKVVKMDDPAAGISYLGDVFDAGPQDQEIIEFWWYTTSTAWSCTVQFFDGAAGNMGYLNGVGDDIYWWNGAANILLKLNIKNTWIHVKMYFDGNIVIFSIDGEGEIRSVFDAGRTDPAEMEFQISAGFIAYVDAIGYSWDTTDYCQIEDTWNFDNDFKSWNVNPYNISTLFPDNWDYYGVHGGTYSVDGEFGIHKKYLEIYDDSDTGFYRSTYSFEDQPVGTSGVDIGWIDTIDVGGVGTILNTLGDHRKIIHYTCAADYLDVWDNFAAGQDTGSIEFWVRFAETNILHWIQIREDPLAASKMINLGFRDTGQFTWYDGAYHDLGAYAANTWYHIRIDFDCAAGGDATDDWHYWINGVSKDGGAGFEYMGAPTTLGGFLLSNKANGDTYIDAVQYSWEAENYIFDYHDDSDNSFPIGTQVWNNFTESQTTGNISFWINGDFDKYFRIYLMNDTDFFTSIKIHDSYLYYLDGTEWVEDIFVSNDWHYVRFEFDTTTDTYNLWFDYTDYNYCDDGITFDLTQIDSDMDFQQGSSGVNRIMFETESGYPVTYMVDALSYSWINSSLDLNLIPTNYSLLYFTVEFEADSLNNYEVLQSLFDYAFNCSSSELVVFSAYNYNTSSWDVINSSVYNGAIVDEHYIMTNLSQYINLSTGNVLFNITVIDFNAEFDFNLDQLVVKIYHKTVLGYLKTLKLLGTWKYRFHLDIELGSYYGTDWIYFNVIEQHANFEGISESKYTTKWILTSTATSGERICVWDDDLTGDSWFLTDFSSRTMGAVTGQADHDAYVWSEDPDVNYGSEIIMDTWTSGPPDFYYKYGYMQHSMTTSYQTENMSTSYLQFYSQNELSNDRWYFYTITDSFDEDTITWNNRPTNVKDSLGYSFFDGYGPFIDLINKPITDNIFMFSPSSGHQITAYTKEAGSNEPYFYYVYNKNYHTTLGEGYVYMQTDISETLGLKSSTFSDVSLSEGDLFVVDLQTTSDNAQLKLYNNGELQKTINILTANTNYGQQEVEAYTDSDVIFDQVKITSGLTDVEYLKLYNIKADHWVFESEEDQKSMYINPFGKGEIIANLGNNSLKIYENDILQIDTYITITYDLTTYVFEAPLPETIFVTFYDSDNEYLDFNNFETYVNYTLNEEAFVSQRLISREFYTDEGTQIEFNVYDSFDTEIYSASRLAKTLMDITLPVYELKIRNEKLVPVEYKLKNNDTEITKSGHLFDNEILEYNIAIGTYIFEYLKEGESEWENFTFSFISNHYFVLNKSKICFLSYSNQRAEYLEFSNYKTYINGTLLYENIFYRDIGVVIGIEIKDRYDISIKNESYVVISGDNYIPVVLTQYSLKVMNQQEQFNHINITRDPNYYESGYYWSEWIAPNEIIKFRLFPGYYKINLTDNENGAYSNYAYTLNGDDILLISSDNIISQVIYNIENVNTTIGNLITNVEINITNQNSAINNSIVNVEINLGNINSTLGNMLVNLDVDITNIANNISTLYVFTNNSFINLNNVMNTSFIYMENNIISINQSISNLVIGISNDIYLINGTISTMISQLETNLLLMNVSIDTALFDLGTTLDLIGSNITNNYILLNNSITLTNTNINDSRIAIINNLLLVNNTISTLVSEVYSAVYLINNSIYTAVVDLGTYLSLMNNTIYGNLSIVLQMNDFLTELYQMTMFSDLLNWTDIGLNTSLLTSQIDAWTFVNNYINQSIEVHLRYQDLIEKLVISADDSIEQYLPNKDVEYNLWSILDGEYLDEWEELDPKNKTVSFGFYEEEIPFDPEPIRNSFNNALILIIFGVGIFLILVGIVLYIQKKNRELQERDKYFNRKLDPTSFSRSMTD